MYYTERNIANKPYRVAVFPHPTVKNRFSYHSEIDSIPVNNPIYSNRGTSIGSYAGAYLAFVSGIYHTEDHILEDDEDE
jgi:hypothetical protein